MVNNNKILTVSYGTFSCTLEGFEDSFGTMTAIAEYFRDLAADDRYFGAEPPQPDADLLARIAQREVSRQVEARRDQSGIVLRATDFQPAHKPVAAPKPAPSADAPTATVSSPVVQDAPAQHSPVQPIPVQATPMQATAPAAEYVAPPSHAPDSIAAKLQRIRAVVSRNEAVQTSALDEDENTDAVMASTINDLSAAMALDDAAAQNWDEPDQTPDERTGKDELDAILARYDAMPDDASVSDAPVSEADAQGDSLEAYDEVYEEEPDAGDEAMLAVLAAVQDDSDEPMAAPVDEDLPVNDWAEEPDAPQNDASELQDDADEFDTDTPEDEQPLDLSAILGSASADEDEDASDADDAADPLATAEDDIFGDIEYAPEADDEDEDQYDDEVINILGDDESAQIIRIKRADLAAALAAGELEAVPEDADLDPDETDPFYASQDSSLSPEEEDDLIRELAEVEAERAAERAATQVEDADTSKEETRPAEAPSGLTDQDHDIEDGDDRSEGLSALPDSEETEEDFSRLMAAAEAKMGTEESSTSRLNYSHLRAAVAAAEADRSSGRGGDGDKQDDVYREDLASVVRPRRPVASSSERPARPVTETRPAPLKLVAEQRIDIGNIRGGRGAVRPRRVSATELDAANPETGGDNAGGFAKYAEEMGANNLSDLLEAAASYLSFVEGRDQFSRPQLMNKVRQLQNHEFNREDGLRSFGQLLREGKIAKTGGGRFTASSDIGFRPDERAAG